MECVAGLALVEARVVDCPFGLGGRADVFVDTVGGGVEGN